MNNYYKLRKKQRNKYSALKISLFIILLLFLGGGYFGYKYFKWIFYPNVELENKKQIYFYVKTGADMDEVLDSLNSKEIIKNKKSLKWVAKKKNYQQNIHPGKYLIKNKMNNNELVDLLRSGKETTVNVTFNIIHTKKELAGSITKNIEADSVEVLHLLNNQKYCNKYGFSPETIMCMFLPNTYEFYWDTNAKELIEKMHKEYENFWTQQRKKKAKDIGLTPLEVSILASIVQAEQNKHPEERPKVAGLFINRLQKGMKLESDPTVIYAKRDLSINRVLDKDKKIDSPYNTYKHKGLPLGPINLPNIKSLKAVLNYDKHNYLFMCAKPDSTGLHNFAKNLRKHNYYARKYRNWLNKKGIYR
ncbi:MAG: endolytic transglycosylase MltG [Flavobacteriales bacterium]